MAVIAVPLLGSALAVGATAFPAHAATWHDTGLSVGEVTADTFGGAGLTAADGTDTNIMLSGTGVHSWSLHGTPPTGVTLLGTTISYSGPPTESPSAVIADATDSAGNAETLQIPVTRTLNSIQVNGPPVTTPASLSALADANTDGTVTFSATSSASNPIDYAESSLPSGLVSGNPVLTYVGGTAAPGMYAVEVTATDTNGAVLKGVFSLTVDASNVYTVGSGGDEVNPFGAGFDVYRQHQYAGAIIVGWTATKADPATHFYILGATHQGAVKFEYAPYGAGTGLCVSDPDGGWKSDPLNDGLILTGCNNGSWQQFVPEPNGTLMNVATGLVVNPNGHGAQLRGGIMPTPWGGSVYGWTNYANLPA